jgi:hypothetical protein
VGSDFFLFLLTELSKGDRLKVRFRQVRYLGERWDVVGFSLALISRCFNGFLRASGSSEEIYLYFIILEDKLSF